MPDKKTILIGSIIHLQNGFADGGYLDTRGWVTDKPVITKWHDPNIRAFVFTHKDKDRSLGSGSWQVLSAEGKENGQPLQNGDKIHLLSMYSGAGYLDSFEWVGNLEPFKNYPMTIGVFTSSVPKRGGGVSGTWTVHSVTDKKDDAEIVEDDAIYLENDYPGAGYLHTWQDVTTHTMQDNNGKNIKMFEDYGGQRLFVFTAVLPLTVSDELHGSHQWTVTLDNPAENLYRVFTQRGDESAPWHDGGILKIGDRKGNPVASLTFKFPTEGIAGSGTVTYKGTNETTASFTAKRDGQQITFSEGTTVIGDWQVGSRDSQNVIKMDLKSEDDDHILTGTITYEEGDTIRFQGIRPQNDSSRLLYDYFYPNLLRGRTIKIEGMIDATYRLLCDSFNGISASLMKDTLMEIRKAKSIGLNSFEAQLEGVLKKTQPTDKQDWLDKVDHSFQIKQLLNLYELSRILNNFFWHELQDVMKQSLEDHQRDQTLAPLHLLRKCAQSIATDHEIIQQAATQRRWNQGLGDNKSTMGEQAEELLLMDKIAIKAIAPFQHLLPGQPDHPAIITYMSDETHIHSLPYTDRFILVGVSYDRVPTSAEFLDAQASTGKEFYAYELMAIPHEVGHYVYRYGKLKGEPGKSGKTFPEISKKFEGNNPYYHWCEEIFADLYGCIVAGPLSVLGMQALLMSIDKDRAWKDDELHPTPAIRFFILTEILRLLPSINAKIKNSQAKWVGPSSFEIVATALDKRWATMIERWGYKRVNPGEGRPTRIYVPDESALYLDRQVNVERVMNGVKPIIIEFAMHLLDAAQLIDSSSDDSKLSTKIPWSSDNFEGLKNYDQKMNELTNLDFAGKKVPYETIVNVKDYTVRHDSVDPDEILQEYLDNWGDKGPSGSGAGAH